MTIYNLSDVPLPNSEIFFTYGDILDNMTKGYRDHLLGLWLVFFMYCMVNWFIEQNYIPAKYRASWDKNSHYIMAVVSLSYPITYIYYLGS